MRIKSKNPIEIGENGSFLPDKFPFLVSKRTWRL